MQQVNPVYFPFNNNGESVQETRYGQFAGIISRCIIAIYAPRALQR
jgi:hypothetical protein